MQMLDKGTAVQGTVKAVENLPSKNPTWDSRWKVTLADGFVFLVGNKGFTQQLERANMEPQECVGHAFIFERTAEGFINLVREGGKLKPGTTIVHTANAAKASVPEPHPKNPNRDFDPLLDELPDFDAEQKAIDAAAEVARSLEEEKARKMVMARLEVEGDLEWALATAEAKVRRMLRQDEPYPVDVIEYDENDNKVEREPKMVLPPIDPTAIRAVVALAATYHISVKDKLRGY